MKTIMGILAVLMFSGCATMFHTRESAFSASSGSAVEVVVLQDGVAVYEGPLPATIKVKNSKDYDVLYKDKNGKTRQIMLEKELNGWVLANVVTLYLGVIIDCITSNASQYAKKIKLPL